jgi:hypothetical protein
VSRRLVLISAPPEAAARSAVLVDMAVGLGLAPILLPARVSRGARDAREAVARMVAQQLTSELWVLERDEGRLAEVQSAELGSWLAARTARPRADQRATRRGPWEAWRLALEGAGMGQDWQDLASEAPAGPQLRVVP